MGGKRGLRLRLRKAMRSACGEYNDGTFVFERENVKNDAGTAV
jgi:hypothetical protein